MRAVQEAVQEKASGLDSCQECAPAAAAHAIVAHALLEAADLPLRAPLPSSLPLIVSSIRGFPFAPWCGPKTLCKNTLGPAPKCSSEWPSDSASL